MDLDYAVILVTLTSGTDPKVPLGLGQVGRGRGGLTITKGLYPVGPGGGGKGWTARVNVDDFRRHLYSPVSTSLHGSPGVDGLVYSESLDPVSVFGDKICLGLGDRDPAYDGRE